MAKPTLQEVFGSFATQSDVALTINKSNLAEVGLTAANDNSAEALLAAIIAIAQKHLTLTNQDSNPDQSITIDDGLPSLITRSDNTYRQISKTINFEKLDTQTTFDPDDY